MTTHIQTLTYINIFTKSKVTLLLISKTLRSKKVFIRHVTTHVNIFIELSKLYYPNEKMEHGYGTSVYINAALWFSRLLIKKLAEKSELRFVSHWSIWEDIQVLLCRNYFAVSTAAPRRCSGLLILFKK